MRNFFIAIFLFISLVSSGKQVEFIGTVQNTQVKVGQRLRVNYSINTRANNFSAPPFEGFNILSGPNQSTTMQWVNGNASHKMEFSFMISPRLPGLYTIKPAKIYVQGKQIESNKIEITVLKGNVDLNAGNVKADENKKIYARISASKTTFYQGEPIVLNQRIYSRISLTKLYNDDFKEIDGFWKKEVPIKSIKLRDTEIKGRHYSYADLRKQILISQTSGKKKIPSFAITVLAQNIRSSFGNSLFDDFFNMGHQDEYPLRSNALTLNVKPLPEAGKPQNFSGAVGEYSIKTSVDKKTLDANDGLTLKLKIKGSGNIELFQMPEISELQDFEVFEPQNVTKAQVHGSTISGSRTAEYLLIPKYSGEYTIPPVSFSYFNPKSKKYIQVKSNPISVTVTGIRKNASVSDNNQLGNTQQRSSSVNVINKDIRYLKSNISFSEREYTPYWSATGYLMLAFPFLLFAVAFGYRKYLDHLHSDISLYRNKRAGSVVRKHLKVAKKVLNSNNIDLFLEEVIKGMMKYLQFKIGMDVAEFSRENVLASMNAAKVDEKDIKETLALFDTCEQARYYKSDNFSAKKVYDDAHQVITNLEKKL